MSYFNPFNPTPNINPKPNFLNHSTYFFNKKTADMVPERAVHNEKLKKRYPQSLMGPYEASQTRINNSTTFFLPAAPFH